MPAEKQAFSNVQIVTKLRNRNFDPDRSFELLSGKSYFLDAWSRTSESRLAM